MLVEVLALGDGGYLELTVHIGFLVLRRLSFVFCGHSGVDGRWVWLPLVFGVVVWWWVLFSD